MRYRINGWYTTDFDIAAEVLGDDGHGRIEETGEAEVLHWTGSHALWSDGRVTGSLLLPRREPGGALTPGGERLIGAAGTWGHVEGGALRATEVERFSSAPGVADLFTRSADGWPYQVEFFRVTWRDGTPDAAYLYSRLNGEDTVTSVFFTPRALLEQAEADGVTGPALGQLGQQLFAGMMAVSAAGTAQ